MPGVLLPGGGVLYGEGETSPYVPPGLCGTASGVGVALSPDGTLWGVTPCDDLPPVLAGSVVLLRASTFTGVDGDDWPNEGTAGSDYDAGAFGEGSGGVGDPIPPEYVTTPEPGFVCGAVDVGMNTPAHFEVPDGAAIDAGTGAFIFAARLRWTGPDAAFEPIAAKITGSPGSTGIGWGFFTGTALGPGLGFIVGDGTNSINLGVGGAELDVDTEYLLVGRLDRDDDTTELFVDGVSVGSADASALGDTNNTNPIIIARSTTAVQVGRDYAYWDRSLTDTEIADLPLP